jgi:hypothetical protein
MPNEPYDPEKDPNDGFNRDTVREAHKAVMATDFPEGVGAPWLSTPRAPERIETIINMLRSVWYANPDQRLGQLLSNYVFGHHADIWHQEDTESEAKLRSLLNDSNRLTCPHPGVMRGETCPSCGGTFGT